MNAIALYRIGRWLYRHRIPILPTLIYQLTKLIFNSVVPPSCEIGSGTQLSYGGIGVVLHSACRIGSGVMIGTNTTIGGNFGAGVPTIGNNVYIAPGARVLGNVKVGDNVIIGANSVVLRDVPSNSVAAGSPARILRSIPEGALNACQGTLTNATNAKSPPAISD
jgi:serine O-acetyltransferase